jgi:hypothetical protein
MSPEQCRGVTDEIDHRTDVYAMGIILYELLCGAPPFVSEGWGDVVLAHLTKPPPSPRSRNSGIPESVEVVIMKALAKSANDRFQSALDMRTALRSMTAVGTFPPRPTAAAMAAATGSTMSGMPVTKAPTTFRTATGEMGSVNTMAETPSAKTKSKRGLVIGAASAAAVAVIGGVFVLKGKTGGDVAPGPAVTPAVTAPAAAVPPPTPAPKPAPRETPPPAPTQVLVRINSEPSGALVTDAKRGVVIGATPFEQRLERKKESTLGVRLAKDGFAPMDLEIPLGGDFEKAVRLEQLKAHGSSKPASKLVSKPAPSSGKKPVVTASAPAASTAPAAPATAPPPVTAQPPPPAGKPKAAEKW